MRSEQEMRRLHVREPPRLDGAITLADYDAAWPRRFEREAARIRAALGDRVRLLEHVGSTSVAGLAAKPIVDIVLALADSGDEPAYVPALEHAGYTLRIREPDWQQHRLFNGPDAGVNLHVFTAGSGEVARMLRFRDRLRAHPAERERYLAVKRELAGREWRYVQDYADAKTAVVEEILARARRLAWEGCPNARDLGGLRTRDGRVTAWGAVVRAGALDALTDAGRAAVAAHGVRTAVDLRNADERPGGPPRLPTLHLPLDGVEDREFWDVWDSGPQFATPLYYRPFLERFPERVARVVTAVARAPEGGVVVHCGAGRDRSGLMALVLLALAGVSADDTAADYALSAPADGVVAFLAARGTTPHEAALAVLDGFDAEDYLRRAGVAPPDLEATRARLVGP